MVACFVAIAVFAVVWAIVTSFVRGIERAVAALRDAAAIYAAFAIFAVVFAIIAGFAGIGGAIAAGSGQGDASARLAAFA